MAEPSIAEVAQAALAKRAQAVRERGRIAQENRAAFPRASAFKELVESTFGATTLKFAEENGRSIGKEPTPGMDWFATTPYRRGK
jgi:hypothetical protein